MPSTDPFPTAIFLFSQELEKIYLVSAYRCFKPFKAIFEQLFDNVH